MSGSHDNVYRFVCGCGLALVVAALLCFVLAHASSLDRRMRFVEAIVPLEAKQPRTKAEEELLALNRELLQVAESAERSVQVVVGAVAALGLMLAVYGAAQWQRVVRPRDERLAALQAEKLQLELALLRDRHAERVLDEVEDEA